MWGVFESGAFEAVFILIFVIFIVMFLFTVVSNIRQWNQNNHSPRLTVEAVVTAKRTEVSHHHSGGANEIHHTTSSTSYYVTFQVESGDRIEFWVSAHEYGTIAEGDRGRLSFQGTRYLGFQREN